MAVTGAITPLNSGEEGQAGREEGEEQSEYYIDSSEDEHPVKK